MALAHWQRTFTDETGNVRANLEVTVIDEATGAQATIYEDVNGNTVKANPFFTDASGYANFFADNGEYRIQATDVDWRYVPIVSTATVNQARDQAQNFRNTARDYRDASAANAADAQTYAGDSQAYRDAAQTAASDASTSASQAQNFRDTAQNYRDSASASASSATTSADNAATSEANAANSETNAASSATAAATSESNATAAVSDAEAARDAAQLAETGAAGHASDAEGFRNQAQNFRNTARDYRDASAINAADAQSYATDSQTYRDAAQTAASDASTSANQAQNFRDTAQNYRDSASASASDATTSANNAAASEANAANSETNAAASATSAAGSASDAEAAVSGAEAARDDAQLAETGAESARDDALGYRNQAQNFRDTARDYRDAAGVHADNAQIYSTDAQGSRDAAQVSASAASQSANQAENFRDTAQAYRDASRDNRDAAAAARDAAQLSAGVYPDTSAGLAGTTDGQYFSIPSSLGAEYLTLYRNEAGSATEIESYPSAAAVSGLWSEGQDINVTATGGTVARTLGDRFREFVHVKDFGAVGDGLTDDTDAVQAALDYAGSIATPTKKAIVLAYSGEYLLKTRNYYPNADWSSCVVVPDNVTFSGLGTATITTNDITTGNRATALLPRGDNIWISGFDFRHTADSPVTVSVGFGNTYDDGIVEGREYRNLKVTDCNFYGAWLSFSVQFSDYADNTSGIDGVIMDRCYSEGKQSGGGGNYNYRSDPMHRVKNTNFSNSTARYGTRAAAFNHYGVLKPQVSNCRSSDNQYGGIEFENGCEQGGVVNFTSDRDYRSLWVDDSSDILFTNITLLNPTGDPLIAVNITREGFAGNLDYETGDIRFVNLRIVNGRISSGPFGMLGGGSFGDIHFDDFSVTNESSAANTLVNLSVANLYSFSNGTIDGAGTLAFTASVSGGDIELFNVKGRPYNGSGTGDINILGSGGEFNAVRCDFTNWDVPAGNSIELGNTQAGEPRRDNNHGIRTFYGISGSPEGSVTAGPSSTAHRPGTGSVYIKKSGIGDSGWEEAATTISGSFEAAINGTNESGTTTVNYSKSGGLVSLKISGFSQPSGNNFLNLTGIPEEIRISSGATGRTEISVLDNDQVVRGQIDITDNDQIVFRIDGSSTGFSANGNKGLPWDIQFTYNQF